MAIISSLTNKCIANALDDESINNGLAIPSLALVNAVSSAADTKINNINNTLTQNYATKNETSSATEIDSALNAKLNVEDVAFEYDNEQYKINLKLNDNKTLSIDCIDFIKDGMLSTVNMSDGILWLTFNTDAGAEPISVSLDSLIDVGKIAEVSAELTGQIDSKADKTDVDNITATVKTISDDYITSDGANTLSTNILKTIDARNYCTTDNVYPRTETSSASELSAMLYDLTHWNKIDSGFVIKENDKPTNGSKIVTLTKNGVNIYTAKAQNDNAIAYDWVNVHWPDYDGNATTFAVVDDLDDFETKASVDYKIADASAAIYTQLTEKFKEIESQKADATSVDYISVNYITIYGANALVNNLSDDVYPKIDNKIKIQDGDSATIVSSETITIHNISDEKYVELLKTPGGINDCDLYCVSSENLNAFGTKIINVNDGVDGMDAVNVNQLCASINNIYRKSETSCVNELTAAFADKADASKVDTINDNVNTISTTYLTKTDANTLSNNVISTIKCTTFNQLNTSAFVSISDKNEETQKETIAIIDAYGIERKDYDNAAEVYSKYVSYTDIVTNDDLNDNVYPKIDNKIKIQDGDSAPIISSETITIHNISDEKYVELLKTPDGIISSDLYCVSSDNLNAFGTRIINVNDGVDDMDAVNVAQMYAALRKLSAELMTEINKLKS